MQCKSSSLRDINTVNSHYAAVSTQNEYDCYELDMFYDNDDNNISDYQPVKYVEVERVLRNAKPTAAGCDGCIGLAFIELLV